MPLIVVHYKERRTVIMETGIRKEQQDKKPFAWGKLGKALLIICAALIVVLAVWRIFFVKKEVDTNPLSTISVTSPAQKNIAVETSLIGMMMPGDVYYVVPKVAGEITKIYVSAGDKVKAGDPICEIDNQKQIDSAKIQLDSAQVQLDAVKDSVAMAKTNLDRMEALYKSGDISAQNYEQVKSGYDQAVAQLSASELQLSAAKLGYDTQVEFSTVTAPASGTVDSTNMTLKGIATQTAQVAVITSDSEGKLQFNVTDRLLKSIEPGDEIRVEKQGEIFSGNVTSKAGMPGQNTGLYLIEAEVDDGGVIARGSSVKVFFVSEKAEDVSSLPTSCIYYDGGKQYVFTITDDAETSAGVMEGNSAAIVHKVEVQTGLSDGETTEILSGVTAADRVAATWTAQLYEGARVQVLGGAN